MFLSCFCFGYAILIKKTHPKGHVIVLVASLPLSSEPRDGVGAVLLGAQKLHILLLVTSWDAIVISIVILLTEN